MTSFFRLAPVPNSFGTVTRVTSLPIAYLLLMTLGVACSTPLGDLDHESVSELESAVVRTSACTMPPSWIGTWFEGGIGDVTITPLGINGKGECIDNVNDFYLFDNKAIGCYSCLQIVGRHESVLQYKESFCYGQDAKDRVCKTIHPETIQRTLIRESTFGLPCPFQGAYHFIYANNSGGHCRSPTSYMTSCASTSHLRIRFRHCPDAAYTYDREVEMHCLATWRDAAHTYALGRLTGPGFNDRDGQYRCLLYQIHGNVIYVSMSADASCRGLVSPMDGPIRMEFTEDLFGSHQSQSCTFPDWIHRRRSPSFVSPRTRSPLVTPTRSAIVWRDLAGTGSTFETDDTGDILRRRVSSRSRPGLQVGWSPQSSSTVTAATSFTVQSFKCLHGWSSNDTYSPVARHRHPLDTFTAMTLVHNICSTTYQCLTLIRRTEGVVEIREGLTGVHHMDQCSDTSMAKTSRANHSVVMLLSDAVPVQTTQCPVRGRYRIFTGASSCISYFQAGCSELNIVEIVSSCSSKPGLQLECIRTWREGDNKLYMIATLPGQQTQLANCFAYSQWRSDTPNMNGTTRNSSFRHRVDGETMMFSVDNECNAGIPNLLRDRVTYVMNINPIPCVEPTEIVTKSAVVSKLPTPASNMSAAGKLLQVGFSTGSGNIGGAHKLSDNARQSREFKAWPLVKNCVSLVSRSSGAFVLTVALFLFAMVTSLSFVTVPTRL